MDTGRKVAKLQVKHDDIIDSLGEDLVVEILSKLPVKSALRCRSVSKHWYALTKTSYFITKHFGHHRHLHRSDHSDHHPILISRSYNNNNPTLGFSLLRDDDEIIKTLSLRLPFVTSNQTFGFVLVGSSNGLVCLYFFIVRINENNKKIRSSTIDDHQAGDEEEEVYQRSILVWNPATEEYRRIPKPDSDSNIPFLDHDEEDDIVRLKHNRLPVPIIGFDFVQDDHHHHHHHDTTTISTEYKLVRVFHHPSYAADHTNKQVIITTFRAQVFVQSTNSWRPAKNELGFPLSRSFDISSITLNGVLYWKVDRAATGGSKCCVMSFDLHEEVFDVIQVPMDLQDQSNNWGHLKLFSWKNKLATVAFQEDNYDLVLWAMSSTSTNPVWTPRFRLKHSVFPNVLQGCWKDQFLFTSLSDYDDDEVVNAAAADNANIMLRKDLYLYDPKTHTKRNILKRGERIDMSYGRLNYVESLAPV